MTPNPTKSSAILEPGAAVTLNRLTIRATRTDDFEAICTLVNLPGFRAGTLRLPYQRPEQTRKWLESQGTDALNVVALVDDIVVGQAGLHPGAGRRAHVAGIGMGVHDDHVGKGIGTALLQEIVDAADNWLGFRRLELAVFADNAPAIRLYENLENPGATPKGLSFARLTTEWHAGITGRRDFAVPQILRCPSAIAPLSGPPAQNRLPRSRALTGIPAFAALATASRSTASTALNTACRTVRVSKRRVT